MELSRVMHRDLGKPSPHYHAISTVLYGTYTSICGNRGGIRIERVPASQLCTVPYPPASCIPPSRSHLILLLFMLLFLLQFMLLFTLLFLFPDPFCRGRGGCGGCGI
jgi:hypothetical protein